MPKLEDSEEKKRGRKPKYETKDLIAFIDHYVNNTKVLSQIDASKLARYVESTFGINFDYRYFNRNKEVKEYIEEFNKIYEINKNKASKEIMLQFNPDKLVDTYRNDPKMLKQHLRGFNVRYEEISERVKEYECQCLENKYEIQKLKESIVELKEQNKSLRAENKALKENVNVLKKFKKFDESIHILGYLVEQNIIKSVNIETFKTVLSQCKLVEFNDGYSYEEIAIDNDSVDSDSVNNEEVILSDDDTSAIDIQESNIINIKDIADSKNDSKNKIESYMERMNKRLKKD